MRIPNFGTVHIPIKAHLDNYIRRHPEMPRSFAMEDLEQIARQKVNEAIHCKFVANSGKNTSIKL
jgi:hypothetical protein